MAPSTTHNHTSDTHGDMDRLPEPLMKYVVRSGSISKEGKSRQLLVEAEKSDTDIVLSNDVEIVSDKTLESSCVDAIETPPEIPI